MSTTRTATSARTRFTATSQPQRTATTKMCGSCASMPRALLATLRLATSALTTLTSTAMKCGATSMWPAGMNAHASARAKPICARWPSTVQRLGCACSRTMRLAGAAVAARLSDRAHACAPPAEAILTRQSTTCATAIRALLARPSQRSEALITPLSAPTGVLSTPSVSLLCTMRLIRRAAFLRSSPSGACRILTSTTVKTTRLVCASRRLVHPLSSAVLVRGRALAALDQLTMMTPLRVRSLRSRAPTAWVILTPLVTTVVTHLPRLRVMLLAVAILAVMTLSLRVTAPTTTATSTMRLTGLASASARLSHCHDTTLFPFKAGGDALLAYLQWPLADARLVRIIT
mmetsp:Transcript_27654/g.60234  ORF Transcript_27654/g.60234 Transcript_27654/m.60234 type:complete len:346 (-) Transcript_27654:841-1878(-)